MTGPRWTPTKRRAVADVFTELLARLDAALDDSPVEIIEIAEVDAFRRHVDGALARAWSLAATTRPPPGSIRISKAPGHARLLRATGDGWILIGRTDGSVVLLLDEVPDAALRVDTDKTDLSGLLDALTAAADRIPSTP